MQVDGVLSHALTVGACLCMAALFTWAGTTKASQPQFSSSLTPGKGVAVYLPGASPALARKALETALQQGSPGQPPLEASDRTFLDPLRARLLPHVGSDLATGQRVACPANGPHFPALVDQASEALDFVEREKAGALLTQAAIAFSCESDPVPPASLARFVFLQGVLEIFLGQVESHFFDQALTIKPDMPQPTEYSLQVQQAFTLARQHMAEVARVPVRYSTSGFAGLTLLVDGARPDSSSALLPAGQHFLQLITPEGKAVGGIALSLQPASGRDSTEWPPLELRPPGIDETLTRLQTAIGQGRPDPGLAGAMEALIRSGEYPWVLVAAPGQGTRPAQALWFYPERVFQLQTIPDAPPSGGTIAAEPNASPPLHASAPSEASLPAKDADSPQVSSSGAGPAPFPAAPRDNASATSSQIARKERGSSPSLSAASSTASAGRSGHVSRAGIGVTVSLGVATLAAAGVSGYLYLSNAGRVVTQSEKEQIVQENIISQTVTGALLVGTGVSAVLTFVLPRQRPGSQAGRRLSGGLQVGLTLLPQRVGMSLAGAW